MNDSSQIYKCSTLKETQRNVLLEVNSVDRSDGDDDYTKYSSQINKRLVIRYFT